MTLDEELVVGWDEIHFLVTDMLGYEPPKLLERRKAIYNRYFGLKKVFSDDLFEEIAS